MASGSLQRHIASTYRVSKQAFGPIIDEVCSAICEEFKGEIPPMSKEDWLKTANDFNRRWNFPNSLGAIDGKHIQIKCPKKGGSLFFNYKGFHSIVLMGIADANYKFLYIDVGGYGSEGDAAYFGNSAVGQKILKNVHTNFPEDALIGSVKTPFYFLADGAFPFTERIMKPFAPRNRSTTCEERIFNYRLSRARRVVENAFGILSAKWLCLSRCMFCGPDRAQKIVAACCILHNLLLSKNADSYCPSSYADWYDNKGNLIEGEWRKNKIHVFHPLNNNKGRKEASDQAEKVRGHLLNYVNSPQGSLSWQKKSIFSK